MDLRRAAEDVWKLTQQGWIEARTNHAAVSLVELGVQLKESHPDMPAEAVELLRSIAQQDVARHKSYEAFTLWAQELAQDFTRRYDAAHQETRT